MQEMNNEDESIRSNSGKMHIAIITRKPEQLLTIYDSDVIQTSEGNCAAYHIAEKKTKKNHEPTFLPSSWFLRYYR